VELRERDRVIARIVPADQPAQPQAEWPDFAARAKKIFGDRILPGADLVIKERGRIDGLRRLELPGLSVQHRPALG
jgi:hypothetical protein